MFDFIYPSAPERAHPLYDRLSIALVAPRAHVACNALTRHMDQAMVWAALDLDLRTHRNLATERSFDCASYYADDANTVAWCAMHEGAYLATIGMPFVRRLVKVCQRIADAVLPLMPDGRAAEGRTIERDAELAALLQGNAAVSEAEALAIVAAWPGADTQGAQIGLGAFALFYDLLRLVWLHEWAHALCGHVALAQEQLGLARLHEFAAERESDATMDGFGFPRYEVLQTLEMHADEFATRYCVGEILWGTDPMGDLAGPSINLIERLVVFNLACCVFAVMWADAERHFLPGETLYPTREQQDEGLLFVTTKTSHPPAPLRYLRFRGFERDLVVHYAQHNPSAAQLPLWVDARSFGLLDPLSQLDPRFYGLRAETPVVARTPDMSRLEAYEAHLLEVATALRPQLERCGFVPTVDPRAG